MCESMTILVKLAFTHIIFKQINLIITRKEINQLAMFCKEVKETTHTCSKQVSSSDTPIPKTTLLLRIVSCTIVEEALEHPWCFWYKVLKVGRRSYLSYAIVISIANE
jgi:hypothetical protein